MNAKRFGIVLALLLPSSLLAFSISQYQPQLKAQTGLVGRLGSIKDRNTMPTYRQPDGISCGPTSVSMVLRYYGKSAGIGPLKTACGTRFYSGPNFGGQRISVGLTLPAGIERGLERYGVSASVQRGNMQSVMNAIDQNRPPILLLRSGRDTWHYVVAVAYYDGGSRIQIHDPGTGQSRTLFARDIQRGWDYSGTYTGGDIPNPRCDVCAGSGRVNAPNPNLQCPTCRGSGEIRVVVTNPITGQDRVISRKRCNICGGSGRLRGNLPKVNCVVCGGRGHLPEPFRSFVGSIAPRNTMIVPIQPPSRFSGGNNGGGNNNNNSTNPNVTSGPRPNLSPSYGTVNLRHGFLPDPYVKSLVAGGSQRVNKGGVNMYVARSPDVRLNYTAGSYPLTIRAESGEDTTLLINLPNGQWIANDDGGGNRNPLIRLSRPQSGRYEIWVGTYNSGTAQAKLIITER